MYDASKQMHKFHETEVTLPSARRTEMKSRRDTNRDSLRRGLKSKEDPAPRLFASQGSYMMRTMVQTPENGVDIDDGVYFSKESLIGPQGADKTSLEARKMVCSALTDGRGFNTPPEVRANCVRVRYNQGYHVDMPVYRIVPDLLREGGERIELASTEWRESDARGVTDWFNQLVTRLSPVSDEDQVRRIVRLMKKFSVSRTSWAGKTASGFAISRLVEECFSPANGRDDESLLRTMESLLARLKSNTVVTHPTLAGENISKTSPDPKTSFLRDCLEQHADDFSSLQAGSCTHAQAMKCWSSIFNTDFFNDQPDPGEGEKEKALFEGPGVPAAVTKGGNPKYA